MSTKIMCIEVSTVPREKVAEIVAVLNSSLVSQHRRRPQTSMQYRFTRISISNTASPLENASPRTSPKQLSKFSGLRVTGRFGRIYSKKSAKPTLESLNEILRRFKKSVSKFLKIFVQPFWASFR